MPDPGHAPRPDPAPAAGAPPLEIDVRFGDGLSAAQRDAFRCAAARWSRAIVGDLPPVVVDGETIRGVLILAEAANLDGAGRELGAAGYTEQRPLTGDRAELLPARGLLRLDHADLLALEADGSLGDVIAHEMGHVLGVGTLWAERGLLARTPYGPTFQGPRAMAEYARLCGSDAPRAVPLERDGGAGTAALHWMEARFGAELMSGWVHGADNPLSALTLASVADLGYTVRMDAADPYTLPPPAPHVQPHRTPNCPHARGTLRPASRILPPGSLA
jgi:hypothetical protein